MYSVDIVWGREDICLQCESAGIDSVGKVKSGPWQGPQLMRKVACSFDVRW